MPNFSYTTNIPFSSNSPSVDQPNMQTNTNSTANILAVDHVTFNAANGGTHKQVTLNTSNIPIAVDGSFVPTIFTNTKDGAGNTLPGSIAQFFGYSGAVANSSGQYTSLSNGSVVLFGGIILKWGVVTGNGTAQNFVSAFPNNVFSAVGTPSAGNSQGVCYVLNLTKSQITIQSGNSSPCYYIAIGN